MNQFRTKARAMAKKGRGGDNMLVHMSKPEVSALAKLANMTGQPGLTTNPHTGMPEALNLKDWLPTIAGLIAGIATGGTSALIPALASGATSLATTGDPVRALGSGLTSFAGGQLTNALFSPAANAATNAATTAAVTPDLATAAGAPVMPDMPQVSTLPSALQGVPGAPPVPTAAPPALPDVPSGLQGVAGAPPSAPVPAPAPQDVMSVVPGSQSWFDRNIGGLFNTGSAGNMNFSNPNWEAAGDVVGSKGFLFPMVGGMALMESANTGNDNGVDMDEENEKARKRYPEAEPFKRKQVKANPYSAFYSEPTFFAAGGGRVPGPTGGMDDMVPAMIDGKGPARLSHGEYVMPADTVSSIGDGSSEAGYAALDRLVDVIRRQKYGRAKQPPKLR